MSRDKTLAADYTKTVSLRQTRDYLSCRECQMLRAWTWFCCCFGLLSFTFAAEPKVELLWPNGAPGALGEAEHDKPKATIFTPIADKAVDSAVVIFPGGGYGVLANGHEGRDIAAWFNERGITAIMIDYRLGTKGYKHPIMMQDGQRAIRFARSKATELKVDANKIGLIGFSAGGHLASTVGTHFDAGNPNATDPIDKVSCRPDFLMLGYPVITMTDLTHGGSRNNLLGKEPKPELIELLSNEKQVTKDTPPTFLFHTNEDTVVLPENSVLFYMALRQHKVPAELHIYEKGQHGVGLAQKNPILKSWSDRLNDWLKVRGVLK
jgi:acetyl esterase/lipase